METAERSALLPTAESGLKWPNSNYTLPNIHRSLEIGVLLQPC